MSLLMKIPSHVKMGIEKSSRLTKPDRIFAPVTMWQTCFLPTEMQTSVLPLSTSSSCHRITHSLHHALRGTRHLAGHVVTVFGCMENGKRWRRSIVSQGRHLSICCLFCRGTVCQGEELKHAKAGGGMTVEKKPASTVLVQGLRIDNCQTPEDYICLWNASILHWRFIWQQPFKVEEWAALPREAQVFDKMLRWVTGFEEVWAIWPHSWVGLYDERRWGRNITTLKS